MPLHQTEGRRVAEALRWYDRVQQPSPDPWARAALLYCLSRLEPAQAAAYYAELTRRQEVRLCGD